MTDTGTGTDRPQRGYPDLHEHIATLERHGLLIRIDHPINKDTELHPLVRWQFRGGLKEAERKAFLFTHVINATGRRYAFPVLVGALAANAEIYRLGLNVDSLDDIAKVWTRALSQAVPPRIVETAPCHDVVLTGGALQGDGNGLDRLPVPISTPGFDVAPYLTATNVISRDPDTGVQNMGTYRGCLKAPDRLGIMMSPVSGGRVHWFKYKKRGEPMPVVFVVGCPPAVSYAGPQKLAIDIDELATAGGLAGAPINVVRAKTVDLLVPAESEFVIEGLIRTDELEPEGPFGESHGHIALEDYNFIMDITAITHRRDAVFPSIISQVTPSESSVIKRVAYEPLFLSHLRDQLGIRAVRRVAMHEPLTNLRPVIFVQFAPDTPRPEVWRALQATAAFQALCGKIVIGVDEDIDPENGDALLWALAYRCNPELDTLIIPNRERGHGPRTDKRSNTDSALLIDATRKGPTPPLALPKREYMEHARQLWEQLGLPTLQPQTPWHGYSMGQWADVWDEAARLAVNGNYRQNGANAAQRRRRDVAPGSPVDDVV